MEDVKAHLEKWGEIVISTDGGTRYELHLGDTNFDFEKRTIRLQTPTAIHIINGDAVEAIEMHYGHVGD